MFNTLRYAKILEEVGFSREQAETSIKILVEIMEDKLASKQDVQELRVEIQHSMAQLKTEVSNSISQLESKLTIRIAIQKLV